MSILDAACGTGWLTHLLKKRYRHVEGCDYSATLLDYARKKHPDCVFTQADITHNFSQPFQSYDAVILSLATHGIQDLRAAYHQLALILKPGGILIITTANPYYSFPVGLWKRSVLGRLFKRKPSLRLRSYNNFVRTSRKFFWKEIIPSYFHTLSETLNDALIEGFRLEKMKEIRLDNPKTNGRSWQLFLFPMVLLFVFKKKE